MRISSWVLPRRGGILLADLPFRSYCCHPVLACAQPRLQKGTKSAYVSRAGDEDAPLEKQQLGGSSSNKVEEVGAKIDGNSSSSTPLPPPLSLLPLPFLLRSLIITTILTSPSLLNPSLGLLTRLCNSRSPLLDPDRNPVLHAVMRTLFFNQYCAGENEAEVRSTVSTIKSMGFKGVILGYAKDIVVETNAPSSGTTAETGETAASGPDDPGNLAIEMWRQGSLRTLKMLGSGDFLAIKFTGAGPTVAEALKKGGTPPPNFWTAMLEICEEAARQDTRVWIDAEQQVFQDTIDAWTTDLMRKYNRDGNACVYNTFQAYLKRTQANIAKHMELASREGWTMAIKLVRGAYIATETRHLIHDTKAETDTAYNSIVDSLLKRSFPNIPNGAPFPEHMRLFVASHNEESVRKAHALHSSRVLSGQPTLAQLELGQLQGMADDVSCRLLQLSQSEALLSPSTPLTKQQRQRQHHLLAPKAFKCLAWGTTRECLQFLVRRAKENKDAVEHTKQGLVDSRAELWRRIRNSLKLSS